MPDLDDFSPERNPAPASHRQPPAVAVTDRPCTAAIGAALCAGMPAVVDTMVTIHGIRKAGTQETEPSFRNTEGTETEEAEAEQWAWEAFCLAHPHEAHAQDRSRFIAFVQSLNPNATAEQIDALIGEPSAAEEAA